MHRLVLCTLAALALAPTAIAATGWTPAKAAAAVKARYTTVDQKAYDYAKARGLTDAMAAAKHGAKVTKAACKGAGRTTRGLYARFHCTVTVQGSARIPPDYVLYTATKRLTVYAKGGRIVEGTR
jgi:hypothetical protein